MSLNEPAPDVCSSDVLEGVDARMHLLWCLSLSSFSLFVCMYSSIYVSTMNEFTRMNRRGDSNKPTTTSQGGRYRAVAHLPTSIIGWVIGHKGCNARMLKQQTGTELWVDVPGQVCQKVATWCGPSPALLLQQ